MKPYPCRLATAADMTFMQLSCQQAQADYWEIIGKERVEWTDEDKNKIGRLTTVIALDRAALQPNAIPLGVLLMNLKVHDNPPRLLVTAMASAKALSDAERIGIYLSMMRFGFSICQTAGIRTASGLVAASNDLVIKTFELVEDHFRFKPAHRNPTIMPDGRPSIFRVGLDIDADYLEALERTLAAGPDGWRL
jgi:hypothetical protein